MIYYCHFNAQIHEFVKDFRDWEFSSYHSILENNSGIVASQKVLEWFGGLVAFKNAHAGRFEKNDIERFAIE